MKYFKVLFLFLLLSGVVLATTPAKDIFIPAGARATGALGTYWKTDIRVYNTCSETANITIYYLPRATYSSHAAQATAILNAGEVRVFENVLETLFGITDNTAGGFRITSNCDLVVESRTWTPAPEGSVGTYGQRIPGIPKDHEIRAGESSNVLYIDNTADFRTNFGMIETSGGGSQVTLRLYDGNNTEIGTQDITLAAYEDKQIDGILSSFGVSSGSNYRVVFQVVSGSAIPYSSQVDNSSGDPIYIDGSVARQAGGNGGGEGCISTGDFIGYSWLTQHEYEELMNAPFVIYMQDNKIYAFRKLYFLYVGQKYYWPMYADDIVFEEPIPLEANVPQDISFTFKWIRASDNSECLEQTTALNLTWDGCSYIGGTAALTMKYLNTCTDREWKDGQGKFYFLLETGINKNVTPPSPEKMKEKLEFKRFPIIK